jgi:hypothetical protein
MRVTIRKATRSVLHLPASAARALREQADREEFARIDETLATVEGGPPDIAHELVSRQPVRPIRQADPDDPLELLWSLQAWRPESARGR